MNFATPQYLWLFVPLLVWVGFFVRSGAHRGKQRRGLLLGVSLLMIIVALMRPQSTSKVPTGKKTSQKLIIVFDISQSMMANDLQPNRLTYGKDLLRNLLAEIPDSKIGLFPFSDSGDWLVPLTYDHDLISGFLDVISPRMRSDSTTDLNQMLYELYRTLNQDAALKKDIENSQSRMILLSDGENHQPIKKENLEFFRKINLPIDTIALGTTAGANLTIQPNYKNPLQRKTVTTKVDEKNLRMISQGTHGFYLKPHPEIIKKYSQKIKSTSFSGFEQFEDRVEAEWFPLFLFLAFCLLMLELIFGRKEYAIVFCLIACFGHLSMAQENSFEVELEKITDDGKKSLLFYNKALERLEKKDYQTAINYFLSSAALTDDLELKKKSLYNMGNAYLQQGEAEPALDSYTQAIDIKSPHKTNNEEINTRSSQNISLIIDLLKKQQQQQEGNSEQCDNPKDKGKPNKFDKQNFSAAQKKKLFDHLMDEEKKALERLHRKRSEKQKQLKGQSDQPW